MRSHKQRFLNLLLVLWLLQPGPPVSPQSGKKPATQPAQRPLDPAKAHLNSSFPIHAGGKPYRFQVNLDKTMTVTGVSVFEPAETTPFQILPACHTELNQQLHQDDENLELLKHADLNFDGFQDLELLIYYVPHLDKNLHCIYLWDNEVGLFRYAPEITDVMDDPQPHPENRTITAQQEWQGGAFESSTYRWKDSRLELIEQNGLYGDWSQQTPRQCGFSFLCRRLVDGKMVTTLEKPVCSVAEMKQLPTCPAAATSPLPKPLQGDPSPARTKLKLPKN